MAFKIVGTGKAIPEKIMTNEDWSKIVDTSDEWIYPRTGIKKRHFLSEEETADQYAAMAAQNALDIANVKAEELTLIIGVTVKGAYITPSLACCVQKHIGADCPAFDVNAACSGFLYAINIASAYLNQPIIKAKPQKILIVAFEGMSRMIDIKDRSTCVLFGDGSGAVVLEQCNEDEGCILEGKISAKGNIDILNIKENEENKPTINMNGPEVYKFAVSSACRDIKEIMKKVGILPEDVAHIVLHQANKRIIDAVAQKLNFPEEKCYINIQEYGNTSAASIPIALDEMNRNGLLKKGEIVVMAAFGGGLTSAAYIIKW